MLKHQKIYLRYAFLKYCNRIVFLDFSICWYSASWFTRPSWPKEDATWRLRCRAVKRRRRTEHLLYWLPETVPCSTTASHALRQWERTHFSWVSKLGMSMLIFFPLQWFYSVRVLINQRIGIEHMLFHSFNKYYICFSSRWRWQRFQNEFSPSAYDWSVPSWIGRRHGISRQSWTSAERCDGDTHPDKFELSTHLWKRQW